MQYDLIIVGAGASGLAATITAAREGMAADELPADGNLAAKQRPKIPMDGGSRNMSILCLEKNEAPGKKLRATGNGRCNLSNSACAEVEKTLAFFRSLGLLTREEEGRIYPYSQQAATVTDVLAEAVRAWGVSLVPDEVVVNIKRVGDNFSVTGASGKTYEGKRLILATGGKAGLQYGSTGDGYGFAKSFGHRLESPLPALVPLVCTEEYQPIVKQAKGVRCKCNVWLCDQRGQLAEASGEVQFTEYGLSGICIFDLSRFMRQASPDKRGIYVRIDLVPDLDEAELREFICSQERIRLDGILPQKLAAVFPKLMQLQSESHGQDGKDEGRRDLDKKTERNDATGINWMEKLEGNCKKNNDKSLAYGLKHLCIPIAGTKGWKEAQVTSGGVPLSQLNPETMESRLVPGLYIVGELADYDGACGGYNLQWAWTSGMRAGKAAGIAFAKEV